MTKLLTKAFEKAAAVLPEYEQDELARRSLSAIESDEKRWDMLFADSAKLEQLADRALEAHRADLTEPLELRLKRKVGDDHDRTNMLRMR